MAWLITAEKYDALVDARTRGQTRAERISQMWSAGTVHLLTAAPRSWQGKWRLTFAPKAEHFGDSILLVMDYVGPIVSVFNCLRKAMLDEQLAGNPWVATGPLQATLNWDDAGQVAGPASPPISVSWQNTLTGVIDMNLALPQSIRGLDAQQRQVLEALRAQAVPCHLVHALAGTGKSYILQAILANWVHARQTNDRYILLTLRNRPLRHEFLETLLANKILQPEQVLWGGGRAA